MSKREKQFYCKLGQAIFNLFSATLIFGGLIGGCALGNFIIHILGF